MVDADVGSGQLHLGIDIGTSWTKVVLLDHSGAAVAKAARPFSVSHLGNGWVEQDPEMVLHNVVAAVHQVREQTPAAGLASIAVTGQGDGCWLTDAAGIPTRAGISWMDARAAPLLRTWLDDGTVQRCFDANGNTLFPGSQAALLRWLAEHEPESLERSATAGYCKDMVFQRLTGVRATDPTDASLPFGTLPGNSYDDELIAACGLTPWSGLLAPVVSPHPSAPLSETAARLLGLPAGTPVTSGPFDMAACAVGAGVTEVGQGLLIVGTSLGCQVVVDSPPKGSHPPG